MTQKEFERRWAARRTNSIFQSYERDPQGEPRQVCIAAETRVLAVEEHGGFRTILLEGGHQVHVLATWEECLKALFRGVP